MQGSREQTPPPWLECLGSGNRDKSVLWSHSKWLTPFPYGKVRITPVYHSIPQSPETQPAAAAQLLLVEEKNEWMEGWVSKRNQVGSQTRQLTWNQRSHGVGSVKASGWILRTNVKSCKVLSHLLPGYLVLWDSMKLPLTSSHLWCSFSLPISLRVMSSFVFLVPSGGLSSFLHRITRVSQLLWHLRSAAPFLNHSTADTWFLPQHC